MILKGVGGRHYLENNLKELGCDVKTVNTYERKPKDSFLEESLLDANTNNYLIVSSKLALEEVIKNIMKFERKYDIILVMPNNRLVADLNINIFKDVLIICNSNNANSYAEILEKHNEEK